MSLNPDPQNLPRRLLVPLIGAAVAVLLWTAILIWRPVWQRAWVPLLAGPDVIPRHWLANLAVLAGLPLLTALGIHRRKAWPRLLLWIWTGACLHALCLVAGQAISYQGGASGVAAMLLLFLVSLHCALSRHAIPPHDPPSPP